LATGLKIGSVRLEYVNGRDSKLAKGTLTAISNTRGLKRAAGAAGRWQRAA